MAQHSTVCSVHTMRTADGMPGKCDCPYPEYAIREARKALGAEMHAAQKLSGAARADALIAAGDRFRLAVRRIRASA